MAERAIRTSGYRTYVDYDKVKQDNRERATSFHWQLDFTRMPSGVYIPPTTILQIRFAEMEEVPTVNYGDLLTTELHGWKFYQNGLNDYSGTFGAKGVDFIDQSLEYAFREMVYEADRPLDHTAKPKDELLWDAVLTQCNNQDVPIKKWVMRDCLLNKFDAPHTFNGQKDVQGDISVGWQSSLVTEVQLNVSGLV